jgi:hypothetical protein
MPSEVLRPNGLKDVDRRYTWHKRAIAELQRRAAGEGEGGASIVGYAAVFWDGSPETEYRLWDDYVERILPGAFDRALKEQDDVRGLFNHNANMVLGRTASGTMELSIDERGLKYNIDPPDTQLGRDIQVSLERKDITGSSFAFVITDQTFREETIDKNTLYIREITGVQLFDVGPVTFPAYTGTDASVAQRSFAAWRSAQRPMKLTLARRRLEIIGLDLRRHGG